MKFIKLTYGWPKRYKFVPADGKAYNALGFDIIAEQNDDGSYTISTFDHKRKEPNNVASELVEVDNTFTVHVGEEVLASYCTIEWNYIRGAYNSHEDYRIAIVDDDVALAETDDDVVKAMIYLQRGNYNDALSLVSKHLDVDMFFDVNDDAHKLLAKMLENGLGVEKDVDKAYMHYLYAKSFEDIARFWSMGYGHDVLDRFNNIDWDEYHALLLLASVGQGEYAYQRMKKIANEWFYKDEEKLSQRQDYLHKHKFVALSRKTACLWAMAKGDHTFGASEKFTLFAGAYLSYLSQGHEGQCSYETDNGGGSKGQHTSVSFAERWIDRGVADGDEFAIKAKAFIQKSKEQQ